MTDQPEWEGEAVTGRAVFERGRLVGLVPDTGKEFRFPREWLGEADDRATGLGLEEGDTVTAVLVTNIDGSRTLRITQI
jgi:hypothetical protein